MEAMEGRKVLRVRGIRGATTCEANTRESIWEATGELLAEMVKRNQVDPEEVAAAIFTSTPDLDAAFPAAAARAMGWTAVPLLGAQEMPVAGSPPRCLRILLLVNTDRTQEEIQHVYLRGAVELRPDLALRSQGM